VPIRILLDENLSPAIAYRLCKLGLEVVPQRDRGWLGLTDWELFRLCREHGFVLCTKNARHFVREHERCRDRGETHPGLLFVTDLPPDGTYWALRELLEGAPDLSLENETRWVPPATPEFIAAHDERP
jgi:hypothetical protein